MLRVVNSAGNISASNFCTLKTMKAKPVEWVWPGYVPSATVMILEGRKGSGKSSVAAAIAAHVSGGTPLPGCAKQKPNGVAWLSHEESYPSVILPRLTAAGVKLTHLGYPESSDQPGVLRRLTLPEGGAWFREWVQAYSVRLVILDPLDSFINGEVKWVDNQAVRGALEPLVAMAESCGCTFLWIRHVRKSTAGSALDHGLGGVAVGNMARVVLRTFTDQHDSDQHYLAGIATNLGEMPPTLTFGMKASKGGARVVWGKVSGKTGEQLAEGAGDEVERSARDDAVAFLMSELNSGMKTAKELKQGADAMGITPRTLRRAKLDLKILSVKKQTDGGAFWMWAKPRHWPEL